MSIFYFFVVIHFIEDFIKNFTKDLNKDFTKGFTKDKVYIYLYMYYHKKTAAKLPAEQSEAIKVPIEARLIKYISTYTC